MMNTEKFDIRELVEELLYMELAKQIEQQYVFNTLKMIQELVEIIMNPSDYALSEIGRRNLEFRIMQMHNQLPL